MRLTRRRLVLAAGLGLVGWRAHASDFVYKGWHVDTGAVDGPLPEAAVRSLQAQIDIVESLTIKPEIKDFFRDVDVKLESNLRDRVGYYFSRGEPTFGPSMRRGYDRVILSTTRVAAPDRPVLLQLLLSAYLTHRVPGGWRSDELRRFFEQARQSGDFPNRSAMLDDPGAFFAICASVVLWGRAAREPFTRARVKEKLPRFYDWVVREFYPNGVL